MIFRITYRTQAGTEFFKEIEAINMDQAKAYSLLHKNRPVGGILRLHIEPMPETGNLIRTKKFRKGSK